MADVAEPSTFFLNQSLRWFRFQHNCHILSRGQTNRSLSEPHCCRPLCSIRVDPSSLPEGLHFAEVTGTDMSRPWRGPVFRIPVTVIKPTVLPTGAAQVATFNGLKLLPGD